MTILALDFDGVMHPSVTTTESKFCCLELLESWLRKRPGVNVAISSSWREVHPFDLLQSFFAEDVLSRVLGVTPLAHQLLGPAESQSDAERAVAIGERQYEIEQWIADISEPSRHWVALDADESLFKHRCQNVLGKGSRVVTMAIKQHWVPQFYLRAFATSTGGDRLWVTDIKQAYAGGYQASRARVNEVAHLSHLYSLPLDDGTFQPDKPNDSGWDDGIDKALQALEAAAGHVWLRLRKLPEPLDLSPGSTARHTLATFLASLHLRNPRMVAVAKFAATAPVVPTLLTQEDRDAFHQAVADVPVDLSPTLAGIGDRTAFLAAQLTLLPDIRAVLTGLHWTVQYFPGNKSAGPLVTSDTPLFCVDRHTMEPTGMASSDCMVFCPLTSRVLLVATSARTTTPDGAVVEGTSDGARAINRFIVHFGQEEVYSGFQLGEDFPFLRDAPTASA